MRAARRQQRKAVVPSSPALVALLVAGALVCAVAVSVLPAARGQQGPTLQPEPAPPMKYITAQERARLAAEGDDTKDRTRLSLELAEARLAQAEQLTAAARFLEASGSLGIYQAIIEDALRFLQRTGVPVNGKVPNKFRDLYKRVELALRGHGPRLETIRRQTPSEEAGNARAAYEYVRQARALALESFYGETVLREGSSQRDATKTPDGERPGSVAPTPDERQQ
ncbi:MAG TPA: hypothetical protein VER32_10475 [Pyrinomonadaceae bacterium]|nr:hypothetical protein [Pyrinomonadaceae bacterium]